MKTDKSIATNKDPLGTISASDDSTTSETGISTASGAEFYDARNQAGGPVSTPWSDAAEFDTIPADKSLTGTKDAAKFSFVDFTPEGV